MSTPALGRSFALLDRVSGSELSGTVDLELLARSLNEEKRSHEAPRFSFGPLHQFRAALSSRLLWPASGGRRDHAQLQLDPLWK
jgi:hypothetical protein